MTSRAKPLARLTTLFREFPVVAIVGPRQVGKTTLAGQFCESVTGPVHSFDLERPADLRKLADPMLALEDLTGTVVLDEIQRLPEVFPVLRVLADRPRRPAQFLVLGSASPELLAQSSESLAGRIAYLELTGFQPAEVGVKLVDRLWLRGGFPRSFLARSDSASFTWREEFVRTFLERDLPQLRVATPAATMRRFWTMLAHYHGQIWNASDLARSLGQSDPMARRHLDVLASTLVVRVLQPYHANLKKRQVKSPKVYIADSGLLHVLLGLPTTDDLRGHARAGASFEGFAMTAVIEAMDARPHECFFWATYSGAELDLLVQRGDRRIGVEFKLSSAPELTPSMRIALADLGLQHLWVVHAGKDVIRLAADVTALPLARVAATRLW
ncbi:MAG: ATP-binding protein [Planctomycetes bacterium]|nr:ATP-binding protein [Planctomycetota bacterium]MCC7396496.1 ATP-binding protein [Planctomycetota bacterium]